MCDPKKTKKKEKTLQEQIVTEIAGWTEINWKLFVSAHAKNLPGIDRVKEELINRGVLIKQEESSGQKVCAVSTADPDALDCLSLSGKALYFTSEDQAREFSNAFFEIYGIKEVVIGKFYQINSYIYEKQDNAL